MKKLIAILFLPLIAIFLSAAGWVYVAPDSGLLNVYSMLFDGSNEYLDIGDKSSLNFERTDDFSGSAWVKQNSINGGTIFGKCNYLSGGSRGWMLYTGGDYKITFVLINNGGSSNYIQIHTNAAVLNDNAYHHVVVTYDGSSSASGALIYIDGSATATTIDVNGLSATSQTVSAESFRIGTDSGSGGNVFNIDANIDEVAIWSRALSSGEVAALRASAKPVDLSTHAAYSDLISWWRMGDLDDAIGQIKDRKGTNHGTPTNMEGGDITADVP